MSHPILRAPALRALEAAHADATPPLMERAGMGATRAALTMMAGPTLILCGPGNNGGDAFVVARRLRELGHDPLVSFIGDPTRLPADARQAHAAWIAAGGHCQSTYPSRPMGLIIDGLFGIGLTRAIEGTHADWIARANASTTPILALDTPSGLNALTGKITGPTLRATRTITFIALKPGLLTGDGPDHCGELLIDDLGLAVEAEGRLVAPELFRAALTPRPRNSHKGSFGEAGIIGGAAGMAGAALLAGRAALRLGAGRVYVGMLERLPVDHAQPELMLRAPAETMAMASALAIGPGLGHADPASAWLHQSLTTEVPLVLDADALNLLARDKQARQRLAVRPAPSFLTPHPAEAARLLECSTADIQADRLAAALEIARRFQAYVILKGCGSVLATPEGHWYINSTGNPGLGTAGSGDVLTGMLLALLAQHWPPTLAMLGATHLHGIAADDCVAAGQGPIGLVAGDLLVPAGRRLNAWVREYAA